MKAPESPRPSGIGIALEDGDFVVALWRMFKNCGKPGCACSGAPAALLLLRRKGELLAIMTSIDSVDAVVSNRAHETDEKLIADHSEMVQRDLDAWPHGGRVILAEVRSADVAVIKSKLSASGAPVVALKRGRSA